MTTTLLIAAGTCVALLGCAALLHLIARMGRAGRALIDALARAPMLDVLITYFTVAPLVVGPIVGGWLGLLGAVAGQVASVLIWVAVHELAHPEVRRGPRIVKVLNHVVGRRRNHAALWVTATVVPMFWIVRMVEIFVYPVLARLVRFPRYKQGEWVNVSRQKFGGLVGHDLIWCLYCDWMTGIWSLGSEMLRNVESFWCPIRFSSTAKCENCRHDFPDVLTQWVPADKSIADVAALLESKYPHNPNSWFGGRVRLTVEGESAEPADAGTA